MNEEKKINFKQLVEVRKEEMEGMLPGLMTEVTDGKNKMFVNSPSCQQRSQFRVKDD